MITLRDLTKKYGVDERKARRVLREEGVRKSHYHWQWRKGTKTLERVEDILSRLQ